MPRRIATRARSSSRRRCSGGPTLAAAGKLFIVAAGKPEAVAICQPLFDALGQRTFIVSHEAPKANLVKLSGNFLIASVIEALGEAIALVSKAGIDRAQYVDLLTATLFGAPVYKTYGALIAEERYHPAGFKAELGYKDVQLALSAAKDLRVPMPMASLISDRFLALIAGGGGALDWSALGLLAKRDAGETTTLHAVRVTTHGSARRDHAGSPEPAKSCPLCPRLVAFREANRARASRLVQRRGPVIRPRQRAAPHRRPRARAEGRQPHRAGPFSATMPASCSTARCSRSGLRVGATMSPRPRRSSLSIA